MVSARKGSVLITSLLIISVLMPLVLICMTRLVNEYNLTSKFYNSTAAFNASEAGIERAIWEIAFNNSAGGQFTDNSFQDTVDGTGSHTLAAYDVTAAASGMDIKIVSTGYVSTNSAPSAQSYDEKRTIQVTYKRHNTFSKGLISLSNITMSGQASTDSYDSSLGAYNALLEDGSRNIGQKGSVAANGSISLSGQAYINGDANPGQNYPFPGSPSPSNYISGSYGTLQVPITVDSAMTADFASTVDAAEDDNDNGNITIVTNGDTMSLSGTALTLSGSQAATLPGGAYYFTSINTSGQSTINVTGASIVYVDSGNVTISGQGIINSTADNQTSNLLIYAYSPEGTTPTISLSGQAAFYGAIYAPTYLVRLTGQENFFGSIFCGSNVDSGQARIHYDLSLLNITPSFAKDGITSWLEIRQ